MRTHGAGDAVTLTLVRGSSSQQVEVTLATRVEDDPDPTQDGSGIVRGHRGTQRRHGRRFVPILFGGAAIVLASIARFSRRERLGTLAFVIAISATAVGVVVGAVIGALSYRLG
ncbi:hypothetical protein [Cellulomonas hominis]|uniref:hypothetical protein n=1 Tax=Cellulomonas hominis TaxID=156981 RepID=UPI0014440C4E|nr:hypothetical protein [Cellulomonas hominis]NKY09615.1 hypothetical protein [Cellulomonas hominis]